VCALSMVRNRNPLLAVGAALAALVVLVLAAPSAAWAQEATPATGSAPLAPAEPALELQAALERARSLYQDGRFDRCQQAYAQIFNATQTAEPAEEGDAELLEAGRVYYASCLLAI